MVTNFIDLNKYEHNFTDCQRGVMAQDHEKIITHISNLRQVKRIPDVIKIFYNIQKEIPSKLIMVGEGPERKKAEALCRELNISHKVVFVGNSNEIDRILCFSDLFLLPSETESFGLSALEAMASGVPVISSDAGGIPEVNLNGFSGYLSPVGDVENMSKNAISILQNEETLRLFKANAKKQASNFGISQIVPQYEAVYQKALKS